MCAGRFPLSLYIKDNFLLNLVPVYTAVSKNIVSANYGGDFISRMMQVGFFVFFFLFFFFLSDLKTVLLSLCV